MIFGPITSASPVSALKPLGRFWGWLMKLRREAYESGFLESKKASKPVVSVGNLTVGGNGKTPMCIFLAKALAERGFKPAILSRGYGRIKAKGKPDPILVSLGQNKPLTNLWESGDEPYLMALKTDAAVVCAKKRALAAQEAVKYGSDILILDDGFQHLALYRDLDILMLRSDKPFGNNLIIPAGPLRENLDTHQRAQVLVALGKKLSPEAAALSRGRPLFLAHLKPIGFQRLSDQTLLPLDCLAGEKTAAFCGLAKPGSFFGSLYDLGLTPEAFISFPDHAPYGPKAIERLTQLMTRNNARFLLTTSKDAVKLSPSLPLPILSLETELEIENSDRFISFVLDLLGLTQGPLR
jgi:tetraacyldisaccharide 4'-kinase